MTANTDAAEAAVDTQRGRVEALYGAQATQKAEEVAWGVRVTAANTAKLAADKASTDATADFDEMVRQRTTRSWLFGIMGLFDTAQWGAECEGSGKAKCAMTETAAAAGSSTWAWAASNKCDTTTAGGAAVTCKMTGIRLTTAGVAPAPATYSGILPAAELKLGAARNAGGGTSNPTGLEQTLETKDYTYAVAPATTKLADALTKFEAW